VQLAKPLTDCYRPHVKTILLATRNAHKVDEIRAILGYNFRYLTLDDFPAAPKVVENADTFAGNATKKAIELARWIQSSEFKVQGSKLLVLADDSGLEVDMLNGKPGVHSARFAALDGRAGGSSANSPDAENSEKLLRLLKTVPLEKRAARFCCVIALAPVLKMENENASPVCYADELELPTQLFDGACEGKILFEPRGQNGFGYDPLFVPDGFEKTFAELGDEVKNKLSHRAKALEKLKEFFNHQDAKAQS
jgi:XTP/dITP diphosphohydrolase